MQSGGNCSLCGAEGATKATCPLNPAAKKPNPDKHDNLRPLSTKGKYYTHDNGGRPYEVKVSGNRVDVRNMVTGTTHNFQAKKVHIGKCESVRNKSMKASEKIGNTILLEMPNGKYIYIGESIKEFQTLSGDRIVSYVSPIGNSDVPYPTALDTGGNAYFIALDVVSDGDNTEKLRYRYIDRQQ
jgi:hypothetical protein